jgi:hypothetical protein
MLLSEDKMQPLEFPASVPPEIQHVVNDLLRYRPTERIQDADSLLERLEALRLIWSGSSINQTPDDSPTIVKAVTQRTAFSGSNIDDKTVAVLDPRLAARSNAPVRDKPTTTKRKINKQAAIYTAFSAALLLGLGIAGYYYSIYQNPAIERSSSSDDTAAMTAKAPSTVFNEVQQIDGGDRESVGQALPNQTPSQTAKRPTVEKTVDSKPSSGGKTPDPKADTEGSGPRPEPSVKRPSDQTMSWPGQILSGTVEKPSTKIKTIEKTGPPPARAAQRDTTVPTPASVGEKIPPLATMPKQDSNETGDKAASDTVIRQEAEPKVAMAMSSAADTQALTDLLEKLRTGIVNKDLPAVERMSMLSENRRRLLGEMFESYSSIDASVGEVKSGLQEAKAVILINKLVLPNGEIIDPAPLVRRTPIIIPREGDSWGRIIW